MTETPAISLAAAIERAATALATDPTEAEREARVILARSPSDPRALLILGSARRRRGDPDAAHKILTPLAAAYPRAARTQYELGLALAALGEVGAAIGALRSAVALSPDLSEAWRALGDVLFKEGEVAAAEAAYAQHSRASVRDPRLTSAAEALLAGRLVEAEQRLRDHLALENENAAALHLLAEVFTRQERHAEAEVLLARCLDLDPGHDGARFIYAGALFRQQKAAQALPHIERLLSQDPRDPAYRNLHAGCLALIGEDARVIEIYEGLLAEYVKQPQIWLNYGHALRAVGRGTDAIIAYRRCLALSPGFTDAYLGLANLKVTSFTSEEVHEMDRLAAHADLSPVDRLALHYALGKALEDCGDYPASFDHYARGAQIRRMNGGYDAEETSLQTRRSKALFTRDFFAARADAGSSSEAPIFIVGLPRAGSTLIEQILATHSDVEGTMELPDIELIARGLRRAGGRAAGPGSYPDVTADLDRAALAALGDGYIETTGIHRKLGRRLFIDKMPNNFAHIGLIHLILPRAKIIDARRHPLGTCFSAFKQHFAQGQGFTYDLADLGRYYRDYVDLMDHFDSVLPGRIHRVLYEDMVENTEGEVRRLLDYCGLSFEPACLKFYENDRAVRTVSSEQVRRPIFRGGLDQWRHYEAWLGPLKAALGPALEGWRGYAYATALNDPATITPSES